MSNKKLTALLLGVLALILTVTSPSILAQPFAAQIELSDIVAGDGSDGYSIDGYEFFGGAGLSVSLIGDINSDSIDDLAVSSITGKHYVIFGRTSGIPASIDLSTLAAGDGTMGFVVLGANSDGTVRSAGDVNNDGIEDLIIGQSLSDYDGAGPGLGEAYIIFGRDTAFPATVDPADIASGTGGDGVVIISPEVDLRFGTEANGIGDFNGDGIDDVVIAAFGNDSSVQQTGSLYVIYGRAEGFPSLLDVSNLASGSGMEGFVASGSDDLISPGLALGGSGDVNGDGVNDLIIGSTVKLVGSETDKCFIIFGRTSGFPSQFLLDSLADGDGSEGFIINPVSADDAFGAAVSIVGDVNLDGVDDMVIGAPTAGSSIAPSPGEAYVVYGRSTSFPPELAITSVLNGTDGFLIDISEFGAGIGEVVGSAGDLNADGIDDLFVGALAFDQNGISSGAGFIVFGRTTEFLATLDLDTVINGDGSLGFVVYGIAGGYSTGETGDNARDVNGDGIDDLIVGAGGASPSQFGAGQSYVLFGRGVDTDADGVADINDNCLLISNSDQTDTDDDGYGNPCDADFNNDCIINFLDVALFTNEFLGMAPLFDLNLDGVVNFLDYAELTGDFLGMPGPGLSTGSCE